MRSIWLACCACLLSHPAAMAAPERAALVIGESSYRHVGPLANPLNDSSAMANLFRSAGFNKVVEKTDLDASAFRRVLADFQEETAGSDVAVVYFSGHGLEFGGQNYLVPIDATIRRLVDVKDETISLDRVLDAVSGASRLKLVILDACRVDPFKSLAQSRAITRGLARIEPTAANEIVAYAAKAGTVAADGENAANSPYTTALLRRLATPGLDVEMALRRTRDDVLLATNRQQEPYFSGSIGGEEVPIVALREAEGARAGVANKPNPLSTFPEPLKVKTVLVRPDGTIQTTPLEKPSLSEQLAEPLGQAAPTPPRPPRRVEDLPLQPVLTPLPVAKPVPKLPAKPDQLAKLLQDTPADPPAEKPQPKPAPQSHTFDLTDITKLLAGDATSKPPEVRANPPMEPDIVPTSPATAVAYKAAILVDAPEDPQKVKTFVGNVVWRSETVNPGPIGTAIRAEVDVPEVGVHLVFQIGRNTEAAFPASHTMELKFTAAADSPVGDIKQIEIPQMRREDMPTGDPLAGVPVTITDNYFLVGLTRGGAEQSNLELIRSRNWFDIPLLLDKKRAAKITFEKGTLGDDIFREALKIWAVAN